VRVHRNGSVVRRSGQAITHLGKERPDQFQLVDHLHLVADGLGIVFQHLLGALKGKTLLFHQMVNRAHVLNIFFRELPVAFTVLLGLQNVEFGFPKANEGRGYMKHLGNLTDGIVNFLDFFLFVSHSEGASSGVRLRFGVEPFMQSNINLIVLGWRSEKKSSTRCQREFVDITVDHCIHLVLPAIFDE